MPSDTALHTHTQTYSHMHTTFQPLVQKKKKKRWSNPSWKRTMKMHFVMFFELLFNMQNFFIVFTLLWLEASVDSVSLPAKISARPQTLLRLHRVCLLPGQKIKCHQRHSDSEFKKWRHKLSKSIVAAVILGAINQSHRSFVRPCHYPSAPHVCVCVYFWKSGLSLKSAVRHDIFYNLVLWITGMRHTTWCHRPLLWPNN